MKSFLVLFVWGLLLFSQLEAETPWHKLEGPYGGIIEPLAIDPSNHLYAVFDQTLSRSTDMGVSWAPIFNNAATFKFGHDARLYTESQGRKIYMSDDEGTSWIGLPLTINGLRLERMAIAVDGTLYFAANERLYVSKNQGEEWTVVSSLFNGNATRVVLGAQNEIFVYGNTQLYVNSETPGEFKQILEADAPIRTVFQAADGAIFVSVGERSGKVLKSTTLGQSWTTTTLPFVHSFYESKNKVLFGAGSTSTLPIRGTSFMSSNNGETWSAVDVGAPIFGFVVNSANDIFVASDGVFVSKNAGATFSNISPNNAKIHTVLNPATNQLFCVTGIDKKYARFWASQNNGSTWTEIDKSIFNHPASYLNAKMVGPDRIWLLLGYSEASDTTIVSSFLYETRDAGRTWKKIRDFSKPAGFDVDKTRNTVYVWITGQKYFYRTDDFGVAWIPTSLPFEVGKMFAASDGLVFGYSTSEIDRIRRLYYSFNKGDKWAYSPDIPYNSSGVARLAVDRFGHIYKLTAIKQSDGTYTLSSLMLSPDYGDTFVNVTPDSGGALGASSTMLCVSTDPNGAVYLAGSHFADVSRNNGSTWKEIFSSEKQNAEVLCLHSNNSVNVYAGTASDGILQTTNKPITFVPKILDGFEVPIAASFGVNWVDYDGDGYDDLFLVNDGPNLLYKNNKDGTFRRITSGRIVTDDEPSRSASWADYNNDGHIDCFVSNGVKDVYNSLYKNNGDGTFAKIIEGNIVEDYGDYRNSAWADFDNDGDLDLYVTEVSEEYPNILYINNGGTHYFTKSKDIVTGAKSLRTYNCGWCDFDNDGDVDIYLANQGPDNLYEQIRPGEFALVGASRIEANAGSAVSCSWGDYDNDGWMDIFVVNYDMPNCLYHNNGDGSFSKVAAPGISTDNKISKGSGWADYDNDGDLDLFVVNRNSYLFYTNDGFGRFSKTEMDEFIYHGGNALAVAWGDKDNNGALDLVISSYDQQSLLYENVVKKNNWFKIRCAGNQTSNRSALGAKVRIVTTVNGQRHTQLRHISASSGHAAQNSLVQHFGLGAATRVDSIIINWPSGKKQILLNKEANQRITVVEAGTDFVQESEEFQPRRYRLLQNYPNPFNPYTSIEYELAETAFVQINIYDSTGRLVKSLVDEIKQAGAHNISWNGKNENSEPVASGLYFYKMVTDNFESVGKMTLLR